MKTSNLLMRNKIHAQSKLKSSDVVYEFQSPYENCALRFVHSTLDTRKKTLNIQFTIYLQNGAIPPHYMDHYDCRTSKTSIVENTTILKKIKDFNHLATCEAMLNKLR